VPATKLVIGTEKQHRREIHGKTDKITIFRKNFFNGPIRCRLEGFSEWIFGERLLRWKIHAPSWKKAMPSWKI